MDVIKDENLAERMHSKNDFDTHTKYLIITIFINTIIALLWLEILILCIDENKFKWPLLIIRHNNTIIQDKKFDDKTFSLKKIRQATTKTPTQKIFINFKFFLNFEKFL